ncbi:hypothetical protein [Wukongibacter baidiensis]
MGKIDDKPVESFALGAIGTLNKISCICEIKDKAIGGMIYETI